jgi:ubiquinone/menaquinone biosynthesis C-methylase UbiE
MDNMKKGIKIDEWAMDLIVDPLNKDSMFFNDKNNKIKSSYGREYEVVDGVMDLRIRNTSVTGDQKVWELGQAHYEKWLKDIKSRNDDQDYDFENKVDQNVYKDLDMNGRVLDIGGGDGRLRAFVDNDSYVVCDPFLDASHLKEKNHILLKTYPFMANQFNFVCSYAEHLPFKSMSFDIVHMRSCIDHFLNPVLALNEAYRVLKKNGSIVIGMYVEGGKSGTQEKIKNYIKDLLGNIGIDRFKDYHVWHPTYSELVSLIEESNFVVEKEVWQPGYNDTVVYLQCKKKYQD